MLGLQTPRFSRLTSNDSSCSLDQAPSTRGQQGTHTLLCNTSEGQMMCVADAVSAATCYLLDHKKEAVPPVDNDDGVSVSPEERSTCRTPKLKPCVYSSTLVTSSPCIVASFPVTELCHLVSRYGQVRNNPAVCAAVCVLIPCASSPPCPCSPSRTITLS